MSDDEPPPQPDELEHLSAGALRVETIDPITGERRLEGLISREHLAQAMLERDEL